MKKPTFKDIQASVPEDPERLGFKYGDIVCLRQSVDPKRILNREYKISQFYGHLVCLDDPVTNRWFWERTEYLKKPGT